jgi:hypothetical protein
MDVETPRVTVTVPVLEAFFVVSVVVEALFVVVVVVVEALL